MTEEEASRQCMALLAAGIPLSLVWDLCLPGAPSSTELLATEPADTSWIRASA